MNITKVSFLVFVLFFGLNACVPTTQTSTSDGGSGMQAGSTNTRKEFKTYDFVYEENIKTPLLYPLIGTANFELNPPIVNISQNTPLILEFDDLNTNAGSYYAKIVHCNADWSVSSLIATQYLNDINEFFISDRKNSMATRIPYIHYKLTLPNVKVSGNYVIMVYQNGDESNLILTKRFIVYQNLVSIFPETKSSLGVQERYTSQQPDFALVYKDIEIVNPMQNLNVVVRQNNRWDKAIYNLKPVYIKDDQRRLEFYYFNLENNFPGYNEFRTFAIRSVNFNDLNVDYLNKTPGFAEVELKTDISTGTQPYTIIPDIDGKFVIENFETKGREVEPDYVYVNFNLKNPGLINGRVFVIGAFNDWAIDPRFEMILQPDQKTYKMKTLLKQGYYNYRYAVIPANGGNPDEVVLEGSHSATQNTYDFLVYYRPIGARTDMVIGYLSQNYQGRR